MRMTSTVVPSSEVKDLLWYSEGKCQRELLFEYSTWADTLPCGEEATVTRGASYFDGPIYTSVSWVTEAYLIIVVSSNNQPWDTGQRVGGVHGVPGIGETVAGLVTLNACERSNFVS
jgi:hypothetical protein